MPETPPPDAGPRTDVASKISKPQPQHGHGQTQRRPRPNGRNHSPRGAWQAHGGSVQAIKQHRAKLERQSNALTAQRQTVKRKAASMLRALDDREARTIRWLREVYRALEIAQAALKSAGQALPEHVDPALATVTAGLQAIFQVQHGPKVYLDPSPQPHHKRQKVAHCPPQAPADSQPCPTQADIPCDGDATSAAVEHVMQPELRESPPDAAPAGQASLGSQHASLQSAVPAQDPVGASALSEEPQPPQKPDTPCMVHQNTAAGASTHALQQAVPVTPAQEPCDPPAGSQPAQEHVQPHLSSPQPPSAASQAKQLPDPPPRPAPAAQAGGSASLTTSHRSWAPGATLRGRGRAAARKLAPAAAAAERPKPVVHGQQQPPQQAARHSEQPARSAVPGRGGDSIRGRGMRARGRGRNHRIPAGASQASPAAPQGAKLDSAVAQLRARLAQGQDEPAQSSADKPAGQDPAQDPGPPHPQTAAAELSVLHQGPEARQDAAGAPERQPAGQHQPETSLTLAEPQPSPAETVLQADVPKLFAQLPYAVPLADIRLIDPAGDGQEGTEAEQLYRYMHDALEQLCTLKDEVPAAEGPSGEGPAPKDRFSCHDYCLQGFKCLVDLARCHSEGGAPVRWGWSRRLRSFLFIFEQANRIIWEPPLHGNATYLFEIESPLPIDDQLVRLIEVLSVRNIRSSSLLEEARLDLTAQAGSQDMQRLQAAGWTPGCSIRQLVNFTGMRLVHRNHRGEKGLQAYREQLTKLLREGAAGGRIIKGPIAE